MCISFTLILGGNDMERLGVDVSKYNGICNFELAKKNGLDFVIIKAGSGYTGEDPNWVRNYNSAVRANLNVGAYWYCYASNVSEAIKEADMFLYSLEGMKFSYPVYLDLENFRCQGSLTNGQRTDIAVAFLDRLERAGYYVGLYTMKYWLDSKLDMSRLSRYDLWIARWESKSHAYKGLGNVYVWQYTNKGKIAGIGSTSEGGVDMNISYIDYPEIIVKKGFNGNSK